MKFIAEIGLNHNGNFDLIFELIKQAKYAGADIAKFQCGWRQGTDELNHMNPERLQKIKKWCDYFDIEFMTSVFTNEAYELVKNLSPKRYKIASRTVIDQPDLVKKISKAEEEIIISLGMWKDHSRLPLDPKEYSNIKYLWCKSLYPTHPWDLEDFPKDFKSSIYFGYSDHSIGIETCLLAIARGAQIIEKQDRKSVV